MITKLVLYGKVKLIIKKEEAKFSNTHKKKLDRLQPEKGQFDKPKRCVIENIIHNFSSYKLSSSEEYALSFGLDQHIPDKFNKNKIQTKKWKVLLPCSSTYGRLRPGKSRWSEN